LVAVTGVVAVAAVDAGSRSSGPGAGASAMGTVRSPVEASAPALSVTAAVNSISCSPCTAETSMTV
jgi:hypothetical protein